METYETCFIGIVDWQKLLFHLSATVSNASNKSKATKEKRRSISNFTKLSIDAKNTLT